MTKKITQQQIVAQARTWLGTKYHHQGRLVASIKQHLREVPKDKMRIGDVLLFKTFKDPQHVGFLSDYPSGGFGIIHCNSSAGKVVEQPISEAWARMITHVYRFKAKQLNSIK